MSRRFAEGRSLKQTPQPSDEKDKKYGIWNDIFLDHVDIHDRSNGKNHYGPVLFRFGLDILLGLPDGTEIRVTKENPFRWYDNERDSDRWFRSIAELSKRLHFGDFGKMLVIRTALGKLDFPRRNARIILDNPKRSGTSGKDVYTHAKNRLTAAAAIGQVEARIEERKCQRSCVCVEEYAKYAPEEIEVYFT